MHALGVGAGGTRHFARFPISSRRSMRTRCVVKQDSALRTCAARFVGDCPRDRHASIAAAPRGEMVWTLHCRAGQSRSDENVQRDWAHRHICTLDWDRRIVCPCLHSACCILRAVCIDRNHEASLTSEDSTRQGLAAGRIAPPAWLCVVCQMACCGAAWLCPEKARRPCVEEHVVGCMLQSGVP